MGRMAYIRSTIIGLTIFMICSLVYSRSRIIDRHLPSTTQESKKSENPLVKKITIWSNDFHISPINDIKHQLASLNVQFIDKSLSGHCHFTKTCARDLKVLNNQNGISPNLEIRKKFYEAYKNDSEMNQVDAFICFHPVAMCELFMPFNRSLIVIASTRYELGRHGEEDWNTLNKNLHIIASNPRNVIAGNNRYDAEYIRYFTGINATVLPSLCTYTKASYQPINSKPFLITSIHGKKFSNHFTLTLTRSLRFLKTSIAVGHLRKLYPDYYEYSQIAQHPGIIYVPYQVSLMSLFEQYRMNIPLFFPTIDLLTDWHLAHRVVSERTWDGISGNTKNASVIRGVLASQMPDPNNEFNRAAIHYWLQFADFYQWPHITYYDSIDDLAIKLTTTDLAAVSEKMKIYNEDVKKDLREKWRQIVDRIAEQKKTWKRMTYQY